MRTARSAASRVALLTPLALLALLACEQAVAQGGRAEIVQPPAWIEHESSPVALSAGTSLPTSTGVSTGASGAVALLLGKTAQLGLGPDSRLYMDIEGAGAYDVPRATLRLADGTVRVLYQDTIATGPSWSIDAGSLRVEGGAGDVWVRRNQQHVAVCVMQGSAQITHPRVGGFSLAQPLSCFESSGDAMPTPVLPIQREDAVRRVTTAAPQAGLGRMRAGAGWVIQLASVGDADRANRLIGELHAAGYAATSEIERTEGKRIYRLRLDGFESRPDANAIATRLTGRFGIERPWVSCPKSPPCQP
ncbi:MAG: SPOR domain-containing protein [Chromatiales bacterium]